MPKSKREASIKQMALEFAEAGPFSDWQEIALLLRYSGFPDARSVLGKNEATRTLINQRCAARLANES
jgi:hypothetical protein